MQLFIKLQASPNFQPSAKTKQKQITYEELSDDDNTTYKSYGICLKPNAEENEQH